MISSPINPQAAHPLSIRVYPCRRVHPSIRRRMRVVCVTINFSWVCRGRPSGRLQWLSSESPAPRLPVVAGGGRGPSTKSAKRAEAHKISSTTHLFSMGYKRVRKSLKTSTFKSLHFHTLAHSFPASIVFSITSQKHTGGGGTPAAAKLEALLELSKLNPIPRITCVAFPDLRRNESQIDCNGLDLRKTRRSIPARQAAPCEASPGARRRASSRPP